MAPSAGYADPILWLITRDLIEEALGNALFPLQAAKRIAHTVLQHSSFAIRTPGYIAGIVNIANNVHAPRYKTWRYMHCNCKHHLVNDER